MVAILNLFRLRLGAVLVHVGLMLMFAVYSTYGGSCTFPSTWTGLWFQSGYQSLISINSSHINPKGECTEIDSNDKFLLYDRSENCYRCMVIHEKHKYVLQYKETYCTQKDSLSSICELITGDAPLLSMFRKEPRPVPQPCPFHPAPFSFTYNRGSYDCASPPSRAESCTDDSRLLLRYMACTDVPGSESNVEELVCLATWKEGSTRYLVGQISQVQRRNSIVFDEDTYRCFVYKAQHGDKSVTYNIAQSGDASCNGLSSPTDGSRTMKLTTSDDEHNRCHFPSWIVKHHKWFSLDRSHQFHFTTKNATLKIMNSEGAYEEKRLVCHSILQQKEGEHITLVAHVTKGCESGHMCVQFYRRARGVVEVRCGAQLWDAPHDACAPHAHMSAYVTLTAPSLVASPCPLSGRYAVSSAHDARDRRTRRQHHGRDELQEEEVADCSEAPDESVSAGCGPGQDTLEFKSACTTTVYTCYGSWTADGTVFALVAPPATNPRPHCLIYTMHTTNDSSVVRVAEAHACDRERALQPARAGEKAYNLTINGTCEQSSKYNSRAHRLAAANFVISSLLYILFR